MAIHRLESPEWHRRIAAVMERLGSPRLLEPLVEAIDAAVANQGIVVFAYRRAGKPRILHDNVGAEARRHIVENYIGRTYLLGPAYNACMGGLASGVHVLRDLAPEGFYQSEFFRRYYKGTNLIDEAYIVDQLGGGRTLLVSIARDRPGPVFGKRDLSRLRTVEPVVRAALEAYWRNFGVAGETDAAAAVSLHAHLEAAFDNFGRSFLTQRECQVARMLLKGHSRKSAAQGLEISPETVKLHCKHIYGKLDITSQAELFSLFLGALASAEATPLDDPLAAYLGAPGGAAG